MVSMSDILNNHDLVLGYTVTISWIIVTPILLWVIISKFAPDLYHEISVLLLVILIYFLIAGFMNGFLAKNRYIMTTLMVCVTIAVIVVVGSVLIANSLPGASIAGALGLGSLFAVIAAVGLIFLLLPPAIIGSRIRFRFNNNDRNENH